MTSKKFTFSTGRADRIAPSKTKIEAHRISHHPTKHTITTLQQLRCWLDCYCCCCCFCCCCCCCYCCSQITRRGASCSPPASSAYRHPMAAVRVFDYFFFATPLLLLLLLLLPLLLCSLWRLSTKCNATTATMNG